MKYLWYRFSDLFFQTATLEPRTTTPALSRVEPRLKRLHTEETHTSYHKNFTLEKIKNKFNEGDTRNFYIFQRHDNQSH